MQNEKHSSASGAQLPVREIEQSSGNEHEHSETPLKSSGNPLDDIAALIAGEEPQDDGQDTQENDGQARQPQDSDDHAAGSGAESAESSDGEQAGESEAPGEKRELSTLVDAAKALGTSTRKLYDLQIPIAPGEEPVTLGELKDAYRNQSEWQQDFASREKSLSEREIRTAQMQQDLAYLQEEIVSKVPPERLRYMQERQEAQLAIEGKLLQSKLPEFRDQHYFNNWRQEAVEYTGRFGFKPHELVIQDHRLIHILHHAMMLEKRLERLASFKPKPAEPPKRKQGGLRQGSETRPPRTNDRAQHIDQVAQLVKGSLK